jgi:hypothetical protein
MTTIIPAPAYVLARAAWIPTLVTWHADGCFTRLEGAPSGVDPLIQLANQTYSAGYASWLEEGHGTRQVS